MAKLFRAEGRRVLTTTSTLGAVAVAVTLGANLARGYPIVSLIAALTLAAALYALWARAGRPGGIAESERLAETSLESD